MEFLLNADRDLFLFLNGLHASWLDMPMYWISNKFFWIPLYMLLLFLVFRHYGWKRALLILLAIALLITLSDQITGFMKGYFQRPRPSHNESLAGLVHTVKGYRGGAWGFVSSHAANSLALALFMISLLAKKIRFIAPIMLTFAILNAYSRIYLGVHYPADILGGMVIGIVVALLVITLWKWADRRLFSSISIVR